MSKLTTETIKLLDKVYNLRGSDSNVLVAIDKDINTCANTYDETSTIRDELQKTIEKLHSDVETLSDEGEKLKNILSGIKEEDYEKLLTTLEIDFHPEDVKEKLETLLPVTVNGLASDIKMSSNELSRVEAKLEETKTQMEELNIRKEEALVNQNRLNRYFDLALESNINSTREELTYLFKGFDFNEDESRECAKLLMFPEDGLFEYEKDYKYSSKEREEVVVSPVEESVNYEDAFTTKPVVEEEFPITFIDAEDIVKEEEIKPVIEEVEEPVIPIEEHTKEDVISYLTELGFDTLDFTSNDIEKINDNFNKELISENVNTIKEMGINTDVFADNIELLYDREMKSKIDKLTSIGKLPQDIYLNPSVLTKYNLNELDSAIKTLEESGLEPKNVPLMAY